MYNERDKLAFIHSGKYKGSSVTTIKLMFNTIAPDEEAAGKDFGEMNDEQTRIAALKVAGLRAMSANLALFLMREYVKWRKVNGLPASDAIFHAKIDVAQKLRGHMVGSARHLLMSLDAIFPNPEDTEIDFINRTFLWLAFLGFLDTEAVRIRSGDVDFTEMRIRSPLDGKPVPICSEAVRDLRHACEMTQLREDRGPHGYFKPRASGDILLRGKQTQEGLPEETVLNGVRTSVSRACARAIRSIGNTRPELSLHLTYKHVYLSGIFCRAYELERIGIAPSFIEAVEHDRAYVPQPEYTSNYTRNKIINTYVRGYEMDYANWKSIFASPDKG